MWLYMILCLTVFRRRGRASNWEDRNRILVLLAGTIRTFRAELNKTLRIWVSDCYDLPHKSLGTQNGRHSRMPLSEIQPLATATHNAVIPECLCRESTT